MKHSKIVIKPSLISLLPSAALLLSSAVLTQAYTEFCFDDKYEDGTDAHDNSLGVSSLLATGSFRTNWPFSGKTIQVDLSNVKKYLTDACANQMSWPKPDYDDCPNFFINTDTYCAVPEYIENGAIEHNYRAIDDTPGLRCVKEALSNFDCKGVTIVDVEPDYPFLIIAGALLFIACCACLNSICHQKSHSSPPPLSSQGLSDTDSNTTLASHSLLNHGSPQRCDIENPELMNEPRRDSSPCNGR